MEIVKEHIANKVSSPKLRFKEFDDICDLIKLKNLTVFKSGGTPSKNNESYWNGNIPWISAASMRGKYYSKSDRTLSEIGVTNGSKLAPKGSLLILVRGSMLYNKVPIGITSRDLAFNQDVKSITVNKNVTVEYLYQWFLSKHNYLLNKVPGTGIGSGKIKTSELKNLNVFLM